MSSETPATQKEYRVLTTFVHALLHYAAWEWACDLPHNRDLELTTLHNYLGTPVPDKANMVQLLQQDRRLVASYCAQSHAEFAVSLALKNDGCKLSRAERGANFDWAYAEIMGLEDKFYRELVEHQSKNFRLH